MHVSGETMKKILLVIAMCTILSTLLLAKGATVSGIVTDQDGEKVLEAPVLLLKEDGSAVGREETGTGFRKKGKFKFEDILPGTYIIKVEGGEAGTANQRITVGADNIKDLELILAVVEEVAPVSTTPVKGTGSEPVAGTEQDYILNELSFELKKMAAEIKHMNSELENLKAMSKMWVNPLAIYSKEIILKNGSTVFGKIVYQDEKTLKVETLVGYLVLDRSTIVRIIDNVVSEEMQEYVPEQIRDSYSPPPMPKLAEPRYTGAASTERAADKRYSANCVLVGNINESKDNQGNVVFAGEIKNIGGRRADFVKVDFVFRKNWSGETKTLTTFVRGAFHTFDSGITTDATLLPGAAGNFELYVPHSFGSFIGYSYVIDWEEYE